jgi:hypothetical protein
MLQIVAIRFNLLQDNDSSPLAPSPVAIGFNLLQSVAKLKFPCGNPGSHTATGTGWRVTPSLGAPAPSSGRFAVAAGNLLI